MCFYSDVVMLHWKGGAALPAGHCAPFFFTLDLCVCGHVGASSSVHVDCCRHCDCVVVAVLVGVKEEGAGSFRSPSLLPYSLF